jgi:hypothetical protein
MKMEGSRGLMITYDPPGPDAPNNIANPNQFPVNTQEICYINVSLHFFFLSLNWILFCILNVFFLKISWRYLEMDNFNSRRAKLN